ncbi:MAG: substrate-binding domain-containing protein, partial [Tannerella sp.]|nr:substrate-binding domain-containing protein [Tannerella sp.]
MKNLALLLTVGFLSVMIAGCEKDDYEPFKITGLTIDNYPKVDGSTTTLGLQYLIACKLLGYPYGWYDMSSHWVSGLDGAYAIAPSKEVPERFFECIQSSKTHDSFIRLIDREVDFILTARTMSDSEKEYAGEAGVTLIETPVALDAFIFITHPENPVKALTTQQVQDIYTGKITDWKDVGGKDAPIQPYRRNKDSGSQELMESLVMQDLEMMDLPEESNIFSMMGVYHHIAEDKNGLCYTVYYYNEWMVRDKIAKIIAVDGVYPDSKTIKNKTYP